MSILTPNEIPTIEDLQGMTPDNIKHLANRHLESYRILRAAYLELLSAHRALRRRQFPNTWRPEDWTMEEWVQKLDDDRLAACSPVGKLLYMDLQSRFWFERWAQREVEVAAMEARLLAEVGPETEDEVRMRREAQMMIR